MHYMWSLCSIFRFAYAFFIRSCFHFEANFLALDGHTSLVHIPYWFLPSFLTLSYNTWNDSTHKWNGHTVYNALAIHMSAKRIGNFCISVSTLFSHKHKLLPQVRKRPQSTLNMHTAHNICPKVRTFENCKVSAPQWNVNITSTADAVYTPATTRKLD